MFQDPSTKINEIKAALADYHPKSELISAPTMAEMRKASILIPFYINSGDLSIIFMKRPDDQSVHGGQISFPGGARDENDETALHTALRETEEEIGVDRNQIDVWGKLTADRVLASQYLVFPFVGMIPSPFSFDLNKNEVEKLIIIPYDYLLDLKNLSIEKFSWKGQRFKTYIFTFEKEKIWGLTARLLVNLITFLNLGKESGVLFRKITK